jgi:bifunctional non-homologous end joining protein LigD
MAARAPKRAPQKKAAAKPRDPLARYRAKRDFHRTSEPAGAQAGHASGRYVIQKHDATRLHYDFRLEIDGVLKSWAVPKGIPLTPGQRILAVMVEDHPLDYGGFEGTIPEGQYGGGTVMLWDRGTFRVGGDEPSKAVREGKLHLFLQGEKLHGEWALVRIHNEDTQWLLMKVGESLKARPRVWDRSVETQRGMEEIARTVKLPDFVEPMKAKLVTHLPASEQWLYELKFDGYRFLGAKAGDEVRLWSRTHNDFTARFAGVAEALAKLKTKSALVDGELVVADELGRPSFQLIQNADENTPVQAFLFDLLQVDGKDLRGEPLEARRARLSSLLPARSATLHFSGELAGEPRTVLAEITECGLEGLVAKRRDSKYEVGRRSGAWVKIKCVREQEFVIGGFTEPKGSRSHFGALLVGYYRGKELVFAGRVGTGFDAKMLRGLHQKMTALKTAKCPFASLPTGRSRWGAQFTRAELARCTWLKPTLVAQPAFLGLRDDKKAREVVREG